MPTNLNKLKQRCKEEWAKIPPECERLINHAENYEQIEELLRVQKETGGFVQVGLECRYSKAYTETKKAIVAGEIGELKNVLGEGNVVLK